MVVLVLISILLAISCNSVNVPEFGDEAPDFIYPNLDNENVSLHQFKGTPIVIVLWDFICPTCPQALADMQQIYEDKSMNKFQPLAINVDNTNTKSIKKFLANKNYTYPVLSDPGGTITEKFGIGLLTPTFIFISKDGVYKEIMVGPAYKNLDELKNKINNL
ncbi:MAG: TlpA disulfide reductase family protein [Bacteroidia bacterium]|nr:TlpA disulfide reductase family protein [Bacteroidia bacterium]